jgi:hypothetical protein
VVLNSSLDISRQKTGTKLYKKLKNALVVFILNISLETGLKGIKTRKVVLALANTGLLHTLDMLTKTCKTSTDVSAFGFRQISRPKICGKLCEICNDVLHFVGYPSNDVFDLLLCSMDDVFNLLVCTKKVVPNALASPPPLAANVAELITACACHMVAAAGDQVDYSPTLLTHLPALLAGQTQRLLSLLVWLR